MIQQSECTARRPDPEPTLDTEARDALLTGDGRVWATFFETHGRLVKATIARVVRRFGISGSSEDVRGRAARQRQGEAAGVLAGARRPVQHLDRAARLAHGVRFSAPEAA